MANARRIEKVEILLKEVIAELVLRDVSFAEGTFVTVTRVEVSEDLYYARILISVLGANEEVEKNALSLLVRHVGEIQHSLNRKLRMRPVPRITFAIDDAEKRRERVEKILSEGNPRDS